MAGIRLRVLIEELSAGWRVMYCSTCLGVIQRHVNLRSAIRILARNCVSCTIVCWRARFLHFLMLCQIGRKMSVNLALGNMSCLPPIERDSKVHIHLPHSPRFPPNTNGFQCPGNRQHLSQRAKSMPGGHLVE